MMSLIDKLVNRITMYRLVLFVLMGLVGLAAVLGFIGALAYSPVAVVGTALWLVGACWLGNRIFSWAFNAPVHNDSAYITGLILALIITPWQGIVSLPLLFWAPVLAIGAKYIMAIKRQHLFNPAALAVVITALTISQSASWWIGNAPMLAAVLVGGILIVQKIRRWDVVWPFLGAAIGTGLVFGLMRGTSLNTIIRQTIVHSPLLFFASIMLTEPFTMPPTKKLRTWYGLVIGLLFSPQIHLASLYSTPELALVTGNFVFYLMARRGRYVMRLKKKVVVAPSVIDFIFEGQRPSFQPGQYLEWALAHAHNDGRGQRRYFTVASSPTENGLRVGVKFYEPSSTYKHALLQLEPGQSIVAGQLDGDFTLPADPTQPLAFIAGGIGVTPFRSMVKYLLDHNQSRPVTMLYANKQAADIVYQDVFEQARNRLGMNTIYVLTDEQNIPPDWTWPRGLITAELIQQEIPDYAKRLFYLSGPQAMVSAYLKTLRQLGLPRKQIKTDYFPGFA